MRMRKEEWAYVLDYLPSGKPLEKIFVPIAQVIGEKYFTLLEVVPKRGAKIEIGKKVYIGSGLRPEINKILRRIRYEDLTDAAKKELEEIVKKIVKEREKEFVEFFNNAGPISTRLHQLELLPRIGKKCLWKILEEREKKKFESFEDIKNRIEGIADPFRIIVERILEEIRGESKHKLFVA